MMQFLELNQIDHEVCLPCWGPMSVMERLVSHGTLSMRSDWEQNQATRGHQLKEENFRNGLHRLSKRQTTLLQTWRFVWAIIILLQCQPFHRNASQNMFPAHSITHMNMILLYCRHPNSLHHRYRLKSWTPSSDPFAAYFNYMNDPCSQSTQHHVTQSIKSIVWFLQWADRHVPWCWVCVEEERKRVRGGPHCRVGSREEVQTSSDRERGHEKAKWVLSMLHRYLHSLTECYLTCHYTNLSTQQTNGIFQLTSVELTKQTNVCQFHFFQMLIPQPLLTAAWGHAHATPHNPDRAHPQQLHHRPWPCHWEDITDILSTSSLHWQLRWHWLGVIHDNNVNPSPWSSYLPSCCLGVQ